MIQSGEVGERHTIPRWNNMSVANALGETSSIREQPQKLTLIDNEVIHFESLLEKWKQEKIFLWLSKLFQVAKL